MAREIDEKVVQLSLDPSKLKAGADAAKSVLNDLNSTIDKPKGENAFKSFLAGIPVVGKALDSLSNGIMNAADKFPILKLAAGVAIGHIMSLASMDIGRKLFDSMFGGMKAGFAEYEMQMRSVQTILANTKSKGESIESVTRVLDDLNSYADMTIYNFAEMTRNIGMFTAAGVGLEESAIAIKGIANLAAMSGSTSQQASTAMYQLSQALSTGTVRLMDWNSVVNAGMGGEQFQEAIKRTARAHGVAVDEIIARQGSFRDSLSEGWLSSEILSESLRMLTSDIENLSDEQLVSMGYRAEEIGLMREVAATAQDAATSYKTWGDVANAVQESVGSGWAKTWQILVGDFEEAKSLWTDIGNYVMNYIDKLSDGRNALVQAFKDAGGRQAILDTLLNLFRAFEKPMVAISRAFNAVFNGNSVGILVTIANALRDLTAGFVMTDDQASMLEETFVGIFTVVKTILTPIAALVGLVAVLGYGFIRAAQWIGGHFLNALLWISSGIAGVITKISDFVKSIDPVGKILSFITAAIKWAGEAWNAFKEGLLSVDLTMVFAPFVVAKQLFDRFAASLTPVVERVKEFFSVLASKISNPFEGTGKSLSFFTSIGQKAGEMLSVLTTKVVELAEVVGGYLGSAVDLMSRFFVELSGSIVNAIPPSIIDSLKDIGAAIIAFGTVDISLSDAFDGLKKGVADLFKSLSDLTNIDIFGVFVYLGDVVAGVWNSFKSLDFSGVVDAIANAFNRLKDIASRVLSTMFEGIADMGAVEWIMSIPSRIGEAFSGLIGMLGPVGDWFNNTLLPSLAGATDWLKNAFGSLKTWLDENGKMVLAMVAQGATLGTIFALIKAFFSAKGGFGLLDTLSELKDLGFGFLDAFRERTEALQKGIKAQALMHIAIGVLALAGAIWILSKVPVENAAISVGILGVAVTGLVFVMKEMDKLDSGGVKMMAVGIALITLAGTIALLGMVIVMLSGLSNEGIIRGSLAIAGIAGILIGFMALLKHVEKISIGDAIALFGLAMTIVLIAGAVALIGLVSQDQLLQGLIVVSIITLILVAFSMLMDKTKGLSISTAIVLIGFAMTMLILAGVVALFGIMDLETAQQGVIILGVVMGMLALTLMSFQKIGNPLGMAVMLLAFTVLLLAVGATLTLFAMMGFERWVQAATMLAATLLILVVAVNAVQGSLAGAAALVVIAAALLIISAAILVVALIPFDMAVGGLLILAAALLVLIGAAYLATGASVGLFALAATILAIAVAVLIGSVAILILAAAFYVFAAAISVIISAITNLINMTNSMNVNLSAMFELSAAMALFAGGLLVVGVAAIVAGAGFLILGIGLLALSVALILFVATAPAAVLAIQSFVEGLAAISMWDIGAATAIAAALGLMAIPLAAFGAAAIVAGAGAVVMASAMMLITSALTIFEPALRRFIVTASGFEPIVANLTNLATAFANLGNNVVSAALGIVTIPAMLLMIGTAVEQVKTGIIAMGTAFVTVVTTMTTAASSVGNALKASLAVVVASMTQMASAVRSGGVQVSDGFTAMAQLATVALAAFINVISATQARSTAAMVLLAAAIKMGVALVVKGFAMMAVGAQSSLNRFQQVVLRASGLSLTAFTVLSRNVRSQTQIVVRTLSQFVSQMTASLARLNVVLRMGVATTSRVMAQLPRTIQASARGAGVAAAAVANAVVRGLVNGLNGQSGPVYSAAYNVGTNVGRGLINGINSGRSGAITAATSVASAALAAAKARLDIHSPSREFMKVGKFAVEGLAVGMLDNKPMVTSAADLIASSVIDEAYRILGEATSDFHPTITPVLDTSVLEKQVSDIPSFFAPPTLLSMDDVNSANGIAAAKSRATQAELATVVSGSEGSSITLNYTQNNTSPKALSHYEIYRQTQNQIKTVKEVMRKK